jgi:hypothetical protein
MSTIDRRRFNAIVTALSLSRAGSLFAQMMAKEDSVPEPEILKFSRNGWMPNNPYLPVLIYRAVASPTDDMASQVETQFRRNGWPPQWRNGLYDFHHYHSTAHEVLGFAGGHAFDVGRRKRPGSAGARRRRRGIADGYGTLPARGQLRFSGGWRLPAGSDVGYLPQRAFGGRGRAHEATSLPCIRPGKRQSRSVEQIVAKRQE